MLKDSYNAIMQVLMLNDAKALHNKVDAFESEHDSPMHTALCLSPPSLCYDTAELCSLIQGL